MEEEKVIPHVQVPSKQDLTPDEKVLYAYIKQYMNTKTRTCYPSLRTIQKQTGFTPRYITELSNSLEAKGVFTVTRRKGKSNLYTFTNWDKFEPFSTEFLNNNKTSKDEKKFIICAQEHMIINPDTHCGKISYSDNMLSQKTGLNRKFIKKVNNSLEDKGYMTPASLKLRDTETGLAREEKFYHLDEFDQAVAYVLQKHEERLDSHDKDIDLLKREVELLKRQLANQNKQDIIL